MSLPLPIHFQSSYLYLVRPAHGIKAQLSWASPSLCPPLFTLIQVTVIFHLGFWSRNPRARPFTLAARPSIHWATVGIICEKPSSALQRLLPLHSDHISPPQCHLQGLYDMAPIYFSNRIWCIFIHYPLTTKTIFHFLKLSSGFITSDTLNMLFSPRIYSLPYSDYFLSALGWRGHPIHLYSKLDSPHCAFRQHSDLLHSMDNFNYIHICMSVPCPRTQPPDRHASPLLHHNTAIVRECVASRRCSIHICSNKDQAVALSCLWARSREWICTSAMPPCSHGMNKLSSIRKCSPFLPRYIFAFPFSSPENYSLLIPRV